MKQIYKLKTKSGKVPFDMWIEGLDIAARAKIRAYIDRVAMGGARQNIKRLRSVEGILEIRINTGPGYRVYYVEGPTHLLLLLGGIKKSQDQDISLAKKYWRAQHE